jgi:hypothetical protein
VAGTIVGIKLVRSQRKRERVKGNRRDREKHNRR